MPPIDMISLIHQGALRKGVMVTSTFRLCVVYSTRNAQAPIRNSVRGLTQLFVLAQHQDFALGRIQLFHGLPDPEHGFGSSFSLRLWSGLS